MGWALSLPRQPDANRALVHEIATLADVNLSANMTWEAEAHQEKDGGRPDLEARRDGDRYAPVAKVEAKLGAAFGEGQLRSYAADLAAKSGGVLAVLIPRYRDQEARAAVWDAFSVSGPGPWRPSEQPSVVVAVITWEEVLAALLQVQSEPQHGEVVQFQGMYQILSGTIIVPITRRADLLAWRDRAGVFENLVDRATRRMSAGAKPLPMGTDPLGGEPEGLEPRGYRRRYVFRPMGTVQPCFSIGVRDPFAEHATPIWLRFHRDTPGFTILRANLEASPVSGKVIVSGGSVWVPLEVPLNADGHQMVDSLVAQAEAIVDAAFG